MPVRSSVPFASARSRPAVAASDSATAFHGPSTATVAPIAPSSGSPASWLTTPPAGSCACRCARMAAASIRPSRW